MTESVTTVSRPRITPKRHRRSLTSVIDSYSCREERIAALLAGWEQGTRSRVYREARAMTIEYRAARGFKARPADILTPPSANTKLAKGARPTFGLTLQSHAVTLIDGTLATCCPWAGLCTGVCVLNRGNGRYASVQRARDWRTDFIALHPLDALTMIGAELKRAVQKHGEILFRPNVNSDIAWRAVVGGTFAELPNVASYGYSKMTLTTDVFGARWERLHGLNHVAYSVSERSDDVAVQQHLDSGGMVAVVTDRQPKQPIEQWHTATVVDADISDEWMVEPAESRGLIGDLSFKTDERDRDRFPRFVRKVGYAIS